MDHIGGQYSPLRGLETVMKTFFVPSRSDGLLSPYSMREWLRPLHPFSDDVTKMGAPWEIRKIVDTHGRPRRRYGKNGSLDDKKSEVIIAFLNGGLWVVKMVLNGTDTFQTLEGTVPTSESCGLWSTGREDEFRHSVGFDLANFEDGGCRYIRANFDPLYARKAPRLSVLRRFHL
ncbi:hypothetical protein FRB97_008078 [Tulasnella sp. 331]|nr:hypothetical protein FRB97_008078 [Tulasnella sp. 331]